MLRTWLKYDLYIRQTRFLEIKILFKFFFSIKYFLYVFGYFLNCVLNGFLYFIVVNSKIKIYIREIFISV